MLKTEFVCLWGRWCAHVHICDHMDFHCVRLKSTWAQIGMLHTTNTQILLSMMDQPCFFSVYSRISPETSLRVEPHSSRLNSNKSVFSKISKAKVNRKLLLTVALCGAVVCTVCCAGLCCTCALLLYCPCDVLPCRVMTGATWPL